MNVLKRAGLSIIRRPGKTLILFLVVFIIGNLIAGAVSIQQAIVKTEETAKLMMGAAVSLQMDNNALMEAYNSGEDPMPGNIDVNTIEQLGKLPEVKYFDYSLDEYLVSTSLNPVQPPPTDDESMVFGSMTNFILRGIYYAPVLALQEGKLSLVEGRTFTQSEIDQGSLVAMISDRLAEANGLHVGDVITLTAEVIDYPTVNASSTMPEMTVLESQDTTLEIIGIFKVENTSFETQQEGLSFQEQIERQRKSELFNIVYAPVAVAREIDDFLMDGYARISEDYVPDEYTYYYTAYYILNEPSDLESFEATAQDLLPDYWTTQSARSQFEQAAAPLKTIKNLMDTALIVIVVAALVIITLIVVLFLRDRRHEFGIYLSLGERKAKILTQVATEVVLVSAIALCLALVSGLALSGTISDFMLDAQLNAGSMGMMGGSGGEVVISYSVGMTDPIMDSGINADTVMENYQIGFSTNYVLLFLGIGLGTVLLACIVPMLYVLRLKPKKILM